MCGDGMVLLRFVCMCSLCVMLCIKVIEQLQGVGFLFLLLVLGVNLGHRAYFENNFISEFIVLVNDIRILF